MPCPQDDKLAAGPIYLQTFTAAPPAPAPEGEAEPEGEEEGYDPEPEPEAPPPQQPLYAAEVRLGSRPPAALQTQPRSLLRNPCRVSELVNRDACPRPTASGAGWVGGAAG